MKYLFYSTGIFLLLSSCATSPESVIVGYEREHNAHDVEGALSFFDNHITFELQGIWVKEGKEEIRKLEEWDSTLNSNLRFLPIRESADTVFCRVVERNDWFAAISMESLVHEPVILIMDDNKIGKIIAVPSIESGEFIQSAMKEIYAWSETVGDSTVATLVQNGQFVYSKENAKTWIALLNKWNKYKMSEQHY